jgi:hypothetical protein
MLDGDLIFDDLNFLHRLFFLILKPIKNEKKSNLNVFFLQHLKGKIKKEIFT